MEANQMEENLQTVETSQQEAIFESVSTGNFLQDPRYEGIGGWLILIVINLFSMPVRLVFTLINDFLPIFTQGTIKILLTEGNEAYSPLWLPLLFFEIMGNLFFIVASIVALICIFQKKRCVPKMCTKDDDYNPDRKSGFCCHRLLIGKSYSLSGAEWP